MIVYSVALLVSNVAWLVALWFAHRSSREQTKALLENTEACDRLATETQACKRTFEKLRDVVDKHYYNDTPKGYRS